MGHGSWGGGLEAHGTLEARAFGSDPRTNVSGRPWKHWSGHPEGGQESLAGEVESPTDGPKTVGCRVTISHSAFCPAHDVGIGQPSRSSESQSQLSYRDSMPAQVQSRLKGSKVMPTSSHLDI